MFRAMLVFEKWSTLHAIGDLRAGLSPNFGEDDLGNPVGLFHPEKIALQSLLPVVFGCGLKFNTF